MDLRWSFGEKINEIKRTLGFSLALHLHLFLYNFRPLATRMRNSAQQPNYVELAHSKEDASTKHSAQPNI